MPMIGGRGMFFSLSTEALSGPMSMTYVLASRLCSVCLKGPIHAGQEVCSGRCRAARSRQRKAGARRERDADIRALLEAALKKLREHP
jgi:predicted nucleic acid-binding Zn ribbon protein